MIKKTAHVSRETVERLIAEGAHTLGLRIDTAQLAILVSFLELLYRWNAVYNLTAVRDPVEMVKLHILDSMAVQPLLSVWLRQTKSTSLLDLGAGAGLPGIVLAVLNPELQVVLVDAVQKKVAFMTQAIGQLKLRNARAVHGRVEQLDIPKVDAVISRAFSDLNLFVSLASPCVKPTGSLLAMQGKPDERVLLPFSRATLHRLSVPGLEAERHLLILDQKKD